MEYLLSASIGSPVFRCSQIHEACCYVVPELFAPRFVCRFVMYIKTLCSLQGSASQGAQLAAEVMMFLT